MFREKPGCLSPGPRLMSPPTLMTVTSRYLASSWHGGLEPDGGSYDTYSREHSVNVEADGCKAARGLNPRRRPGPRRTEPQEGELACSPQPGSSTFLTARQVLQTGQSSTRAHLHTCVCASTHTHARKPGLSIPIPNHLICKRRSVHCAGQHMRR